ncbi:MAG: hypothetical protein ABUK11_07600 [Mariprofundaceae bacterium]
MNTFRAKKIADHFSGVGTFYVSNNLHGVSVSYMGYQACFEDEQQLWAFLFHIAQASHQESLIEEAEAKLIA